MNTGYSSMKALEIFYSYASEDSELVYQLDDHLSGLKSKGKVVGWDKRNILAGTEPAREIDTHLHTADIVLLFISSKFINCQEIEVRKAMERHEAKSARVIPILLKPCDWQSAAFSKLQRLPLGDRPVVKWEDLDEAFLNIVREIERVIDDLNKRPPPENPILRKNVTTALGENVSEEQRKEAAQGIIDVLRDLSSQNKKVNELKRVHNMLHDLELALEPLVRQLQIHSQISRIDIKDSWWGVTVKIEDLQHFASKMKFLEETPFTVTVNGASLIGPKWVIELVSRQNAFQNSLEEQATLKDINELSQLSHDLLAQCRTHLYRIDRRLLEEVDRLDQLSDQVLRSTSNDASKA